MTEQETLTSVFGDATTAARIPEVAYAALKATIPIYHLEDQKDLLKAKYVEMLNSPGANEVRAKGGDVWMFGVRTLRAYFANTAFGPKAHPFVFVPTSVSGRPIKKDDEKRGLSYNVRMWGLAVSRDKELNFEGPTGLTIYGFATEADAQRAIDSVHARKAYLIRARLSDQSPLGVLGLGKVGILNATAGDPIEVAPAAENGGPWTDLFARIKQCLPLQSVASFVKKPKEYDPYLVELMVTRGTTQSNKSGTFAILSGIDDSLSGDPQLMADLKGGLGLFLPRDDMVLARLPVGSMVEAVISGTERDDTDRATGNPTGSKSWRWSALAIRTTIDMSGGSVIPNPSEVAVTLPSKPKATDAGPTTRDL